MLQPNRRKFRKEHKGRNMVLPPAVPMCPSAISA